MTEYTVDLSTKKLMCPSLGTIQCNTDPVKLFFRDETILTIFPNKIEADQYKEKNPEENVSHESDYQVDLKNLLGIQCQDFYVSFYLLDDNRIKEYQADPEGTWFNALYHFIDYEVDGGWVACKEHNELSFYDSIFKD